MSGTNPPNPTDGDDTGGQQLLRDIAQGVAGLVSQQFPWTMEKRDYGAEVIPYFPAITQFPSSSQQFSQGAAVTLAVNFYQRNANDQFYDSDTPNTNNLPNINVKGADSDPSGAGAAPIPTVSFQKEHYVNGREFSEEWRSAWQRAIALAWTDIQGTGLKGQLLKNPFHFLKKYCGFTLPPTVDLVLVDTTQVVQGTLGQNLGFVQSSLPAVNPMDTFSSHDPNGDDPGKNAPGTNDPLRGETGWQWILPRSVLIMFLPPPPGGWGSPNSQCAVALAAYEAVGKSYPFTVCG